MERRSAAEEEFLGQATKDFPVRNKDEPVPNIEFVLVIFQENVDMLEKTCLS